MPRFSTLAIAAALLVLGAPAVAGAKGIEAAQVCGASECRDVKDHVLLMRLTSGGDSANPPRDPSPAWYRVDVVARGDGERHELTLAALPGTRRLRSYNEEDRRYVWWEMTDETVSAYREVTAGLAPRAASTLKSLDRKLSEARVDEVVEPPAEPAAAGFPWEWAGGGAASAALAGAALVTRRRRRGARLHRPGPQASG